MNDEKEPVGATHRVIMDEPRAAGQRRESWFMKYMWR
jgi:hypothetical protein